MEYLYAVAVYLLLITLLLIEASCPPGATDHVCDCQYYYDAIEVDCTGKQLLTVPDLSIFRGIVCSDV